MFLGRVRFYSDSIFYINVDLAVLKIFQQNPYVFGRINLKVLDFRQKVPESERVTHLSILPIHRNKTQPKPTCGMAL